MPDIITAAEQDAITAFLASGGKITKCPTRYADVPVTGAVPMTNGTTSNVREKTLREKLSEVAERAKNRRKIKAEECKRKANNFEKRRERARANAELINRRRKESIDRKIGAALRFIGDEWTWPKIREASGSLGYKTPKHLTSFLRAHGHGENIPQRDYVRKPSVISPVKKQRSDASKRAKMERYSIISADYSAGLPLKEIREKHSCGDDTIFRAIKATGIERRKRTLVQYDPETRAGILSDYDAMVSIPDMVAKWHVADDTIRRIAAEAGREKRPRVVKKTAHIYAARLSDRDQQIRADYEAYVTMDEMRIRWGLGKKAIFEAAIRAGATKRKTIRKKQPISDRDVKIASAYKEGAEVSTICSMFNTSPRTVYRAVSRCKITVRDGVKTRDQIKREAKERSARAIELHKQGKTNAEIMKIIGYLNESTPRKIVAEWRKNQQVNK